MRGKVEGDGKRYTISPRINEEGRVYYTGFDRIEGKEVGIPDFDYLMVKRQVDKFNQQEDGEEFGKKDGGMLMKLER